MTAPQRFRQIDTKALYRLADVFQKEVSSLIQYYLKESKKLMDKLQQQFINKEFGEISTTARELRENSLEIGASYFSFIMLGLEISAQECRCYPSENLYQLIEQNYNRVAHELLAISHTSYPI